MAAGAAEAPTAWTTGTKQVLVIRVDFSDVPGEPISQQAAQLHALGHALVQVGGGAVAVLGDKAAEGGAPASGHPAEHCLAFHAIDSALEFTGTAAVKGSMATRFASLSSLAHFTMRRSQSHQSRQLSKCEGKPFVFSNSGR